MKTLKEILQLEVYEPKSPDEKRFKDKHVVVKHKDANGNDDNLFNAKNIKTVNRTPEHGYNPGEDEKVYEETIEEKSKIEHPLFTAARNRTVALNQKEKKKNKTPKNEEFEELEYFETLDERVTRKLSPKEQSKIAKVMREFSAGELKDSHGKQVTDKKQALAIAYSQMNESSDEQSLIAIKKAYKDTFNKRSPGIVAKRNELKAAAKEATSPPSTTKRMSKILKGIDVNRIRAPEYPKEMLGPADAGPDERYGSGPMDPTRALAKVPGKGVVVGTLDPNYKKPSKSTKSKK
jgi:hypothetical protein